MYTFSSAFIMSIKSDESQCLRGNESEILAKSLHSFLKTFTTKFVINFSIWKYHLFLNKWSQFNINNLYLLSGTSFRKVN